MSNKILVRYREGFGRMGDLTETFVTTRLELRALKAIGEVYQGEVLGKHSEITSTLDDDTLKVLCDDHGWIERGEGYGVLDGCPFVGMLADLRHDNDSAAAQQADALEAKLSKRDFKAICKAWGLS